MIETLMLPNVKNEFPELFTKRGRLRKQAPKRFMCSCGCHFNKTKTAQFPNLGVAFSINKCPSCNQRVKEAPSYSVWKRMSENQIEVEDFILDTVQKHGVISKDTLVPIVVNKFGEESRALGFLVYFGYLKVDEEKRDTLDIVDYTINEEKILHKRYERIQ